MEDRKILYADEGMVLTDGTAYGKVVYLAGGAEEVVWHEITEAEYQEIINSEPAEEPDYLQSK